MTELQGSVKETCHICKKEMEWDNTGRCSSCAQTFHLPWSVNVEDRQCGRIVFHREVAGMILVCKQCFQDLGLGQ